MEARNMVHSDSMSPVFPGTWSKLSRRCDLNLFFLQATLLGVPRRPSQYVWVCRVCPASFPTIGANSPPGGNQLTALPLSSPGCPEHAAVVNPREGDPMFELCPAGLHGPPGAYQRAPPPGLAPGGGPDLADWEATEAALQHIGSIDLLVNSAACTSLQPFLEVTPEQFDKLFNVNVKAALHVSQIVAHGMIARGSGGSIVNVSSQASQCALRDHTIYCATKAALDMLTKMMALELGPHKIRVNSVNPTVVMTEMGRLAWSEPEKASAMTSRIPLGHFAEVEDVVNTILFLLSDKSKMTNGVTLPVDGGFLAC
ncbi:L-xylulose reductase [Takifugu flavidus]|uniref:L-xylulose reductase n=1 Tax=Takifugu flavidus TaxID=433684 RepID=A0A5C6PS75_9TELE|nr:L-xylulose reductase [Takifugu flavidus]